MNALFLKTDIMQSLSSATNITDDDGDSQLVDASTGGVSGGDTSPFDGDEGLGVGSCFRRPDESISQHFFRSEGIAQGSLQRVSCQKYPLRTIYEGNTGEQRE
ncbi:hypothetical protein FRC04_010539 [Tulasnella sp. 424]|nr:hypothetical protein FRC04_010539 [Tulasnella sp. 424]